MNQVSGVSRTNEEAEVLKGLCDWVKVESPSYDRAGVNRMMDIASDAMRELGATITRIPGRDNLGDTVTARMPWGGDGPGILVLGHLDTVHLKGTITGPLPVRRDGDRLWGPGIYDMKGGVYIAYHALRRIVRAGEETHLPVTFMFIPDEELGSPTTREYIEAESMKNRFVLVPEPAQDRGNLITGRWAFARFLLTTKGKPAHAGAFLNKGSSAINEMANQIIRIEEMSEPDRNVTFSVGVINGGTFVNVVPAECTAQVLAVAPTQADLDDVCNRMMALKPINPEVPFKVKQGAIRPLFEPSEAVIGLYTMAASFAKEAGYEPGHGMVGGGSDGNFSGALGIPTLDGLGLCGEDFHTHNEHIYVSSVLPRCDVFEQMLRTLK
ncbi:MAG TPA: carboxypeptidase [Gammaproteobacteria bacterium]|nr:carboxypeptidase [Gammaproteobacteria bacterium]|tara:strand:- start:50 stop:1195 length:1146 start_codon:yes stop_codon:yes gene_type:complete